MLPHPGIRGCDVGILIGLRPLAQASLLRGALFLEVEVVQWENVALDRIRIISLAGLCRNFGHSFQPFVDCIVGISRNNDAMISLQIQVSHF